LDRERFEEIFWQIREHPEKAQSKRVEEVLELLSSLRDDLSKSEKLGIITRLRGLLSAYQWVVQVDPTPDGYRAIHTIADRGRLSQDDLWERRAIRDLLDVVPYLGKRPRIRRCAECSEWFYAAQREDQEWCSSNCRQHHYDSDPEMRGRKKLYMRKHRLEEKKREESIKRRVGFGSRVKSSAKKSLR
ncbi:MAG TPA: hypothetical protein VNO32_33115, partial [Candidatus Acidoferrum sp.]|nr:hypothetical protein [Candidatus Acidoferrum sp.]